MPRHPHSLARASLATGLASALMALAAPAAQAAAAACPAVAQPTITLGTLDTGIANRSAADCRSADQRISDESPWGSQAAFVAHVASISQALQRERLLSAAERARLLSAALQSGIGSTLTVKLIAFNDFHGTIKPFEGSSSNPGVTRLATRIAELRAANPLNAVVSAGDMIGASPLTSALFKDEPTIEAMNRIGIDFNAVGNHEFDEGRDELLRMQHGGNHPTDPYTGLGLAQDKRNGQFAGARFQFLSANVTDTTSGQTLLAPYGIKHFLGHPVAFVGMTLESTPTIVSPAGVRGLAFGDEADTVNALVPTLQARGVRSVVVLLHEGGFAAGGANGCTGASGPIVDIVARLDPEVDLVITGHTHQAYNCLLPKRDGSLVRVTSAGQYARNLTDINLTLDTRSRNVLAVTATNLGTGTSTAEHPGLTDLVAHYDALSVGPKSRVIGTITAPISRQNNAAGESALGDVIADAQLAATAPAGFGQAQIAFMNPGGIRADLPLNAGGRVTYGDAFTVQPFGNSLVTMTLSGAQVRQVLEQQFAGCYGQTVQRILQVSAGFAYSLVPAAACGSRVQGVTVAGQPLQDAAGYRVTVNSFLADGGDGFTTLVAGTQRLGGAVDLDAFEAYLLANPNGVAPGPQNRITLVP